MSLKICVLGNSHVAAFKDGWNPKGLKRKDIEADFFGCLKDGMASFAQRPDGLFGPTEEGAAAFFKSIATTGDFVDVDSYDAFVLVGMKFFPNGLIRNYANFATPDSNNHASAGQMVSPEVLEAALWDELKDGMMLHVASVLKARTGSPIFVVWQPHLSEALKEIEWRAALYEPILKNKDANYVSDIMARIDLRLENLGLHVLRQPEASLSEGVMTARKWSDGSRQFRVGGGSEHRDHDVFHMNSAFGELCWKTWMSGGPLAKTLPKLKPIKVSA